MIRTPTPTPTPSSGAMNMIAALLEQRAGQQIAANRAWRIEAALKPILRERGLATLDELVTELIVARTGGLGDQVVDALLNQETSFFRDAAVLDGVGEAAAQLQAEAGNRRIRIWSAGCSTGQEPLSLAMLFAERGIGEGLMAPEIIATDISPAALARPALAIAPGMPHTTELAWSWTSMRAPWSAISAAPSQPSRPMPLSTTPSERRP